jgi:hypothetical protein
MPFKSAPIAFIAESPHGTIQIQLIANWLSVAAGTPGGGKIPGKMPAPKAMPSNALNNRDDFRCCRAAVIVLKDAR